MKLITKVDLTTISAHEAKQVRINVRLGSYNMPPAEEFENWHLIFDEHDLDRLFLIYSDFLKHTDETCKLRMVKPDKSDIIQEKMRENIDLRVSPDLAPVIVCADLHSSPLTVIDGNHRISAHYLLHGSVEGVQAFVCVHPRIPTWNFVALAARK